MKFDQIKIEVLKRLAIGSDISIRTFDMRRVCKQETRKSRVLAFYPFHVLAINDIGLRESFTYFDLYQMFHGAALEERVYNDR